MAKSGVFDLHDIKGYYKATLLKTVYSWHTGWNRKEGPEMDSHWYS